MWIATIDADGIVQRYDWTDRYTLLRDAAGTPYPGYMIHEAICWSEVHKSWYILPRRVSSAAYDEKTDEKMGSNTLLIANEAFTEVTVKHITPLTPTRGFSTFKFVPGTNDDVIVALKSEENEALGTQTSHITVFEVSSGNILLPETEIAGGFKFEGLEFVDTWEH